MSIEATTSPDVRPARLAGGVTLPFVEQGDRDGVPLVLLHGITDHWGSYLPVLPHLRSDLRAFAVTQRGHGGASQPEQGYAVGDLGRDVIEFLDAAGLPRAVIAGHSLGALAALQAAIDAPERVSGLVLAPGFARAADTPAVAELVAAVHALRDPIDRGFVEALQAQALEPHLPEGFFATMVEHTLQIPARILQALMNGVSAMDLTARLERVTAPVLLVRGEGDALVPQATQDVLLGGLRRAELRVYPGCGHTPHWDDPARFAADVARFALAHD